MATRLRPSLKDRVAGSGRTTTQLISDEATDKAVDISTGGRLPRHCQLLSQMGTYQTHE